MSLQLCLCQKRNVTNFFPFCVSAVSAADTLTAVIEHSRVIVLVSELQFFLFEAMREEFAKKPTYS